MGYNIGMRLIEDFLAKSGAQACSNFREVAEMISKVCLLAHLDGNEGRERGRGIGMRWDGKGKWMECAYGRIFRSASKCS